MRTLFALLLGYFLYSCGYEDGNLNMSISISSYLMEDVDSVRISILTQELKSGGRQEISCEDFQYLQPNFSPTATDFNLADTPAIIDFDPEGDPSHHKFKELPPGKVVVIAQAINKELERIVAAACEEAEISAGKKTTVRLVLEPIF